MRAFTSLEERDKLKSSFYGGLVWNRHIEPLVMPMIAHFEADLVATSCGFEDFGGRASF